MPTATPTQLGAYRIVRALSPQKSFLAEDEAGRRVVLKLLDPDCILDGELHPSIHDRLSRVRELAQNNVANLYGVERDLDVVFMVWEFVDAVPFVEYASSADLSDRDLLALMRELALAVESMHARGIVHGAIHDGNVLVDREGKIRLIDVSPLLYHDPGVDERAVIELLREASRARSPLSEMITESLESLDANHTSLRRLTDALAILAKPDEPGRQPMDERPLRLRVRTLVFALLVAILGVATVFTVRAIVVRQTINTNAPAPVKPMLP
ncbi:MAG TPA: lipopolysaccharide core heptose(II) kinase RfaY [Tepidisphaeraceae bacterium]|jgi:serine/threonine protein kinase|nr:lipopolysaccharide core heptose(II) kinase RfaY [Tepidisphaeraceae bacterium]